MARLLRMPEVAANATEAVLADWLVAEDGSFEPADTLATVETEKALVDVEADSAGVMLKALVPAGSQVEVGSPIAVLIDAGEQVEDLDALLRELGVSNKVATRTPERREVPEMREVPQTGSAPDVPAEPDVPALDVPADVPASPNGRVFASPLARRLAREAGLSVEDIDGTGPRNRILRRDVERALDRRTVPPTRHELPAAAGYEDVPHSRMRRAIATRLTESKQTAPHFYLRATIRVDRLLEVRAELNERAPVKISLNDLVVKAVGRAHLLVPEMNVVWTEDAVRSYSGVDLSVAVATERGLLTPVVRGVEKLSVSAVAAQVRDLADRARSGRLKQDELDGGTICVTNLGMFGTEDFAAIINPPQAAILAVGAVRQEPVVDDCGLVVGSVMRVTLSVDHRPVDGVDAARWMSALVALLEHPVQILA